MEEQAVEPLRVTPCLLLTGAWGINRPLMTIMMEIYVHIVARMADYITTHPYTGSYWPHYSN